MLKSENEAGSGPNLEDFYKDRDWQLILQKKTNRMREKMTQAKRKNVWSTKLDVQQQTGVC